MTLLFDENLSDRIIDEVADIFPESTHVKHLGLTGTEDVQIWDYAKERGFSLVSKDTDFYQRAVVFGHPPKLIWIRAGNCPTEWVSKTLRNEHEVIRQFIANATQSVLILGSPAQ